MNHRLQCTKEVYKLADLIQAYSFAAFDIISQLSGQILVHILWRWTLELIGLQD